MIIPIISIAAIDVLDNIAATLQTGNAKELVKYFDSSIDLTILDQENSYSSSQAAMVVQSFFDKNPVKSFQLVHKSTSGDGSYGIGNLVTTTQTFRTYFYVKQKSGVALIQELRFEKQ